MPAPMNCTSPSLLVIPRPGASGLQVWPCSNLSDWMCGHFLESFLQMHIYACHALVFNACHSFSGVARDSNINACMLCKHLHTACSTYYLHVCSSARMHAGAGVLGRTWAACSPTCFACVLKTSRAWHHSDTRLTGSEVCLQVCPQSSYLAC